MKIWPLKIKNAEDVYRINEEGEGGFYPVGANNAWHSGIHIPTPADSPITPVIEGTLVAYRINATYHKENITGDITRREYEYLRIEDRAFYEMYTAEEDLIKFLLQNYKLIDPNTPLIHRYPTNFALLQHELKLRGQNDPLYFSLFIPI